ncbi:YjbH domain-containing protein [Marinomonas rhizomae]|uniref:Exopolysaccharide biosynthesis protein YbjH n=1 Tax=Marinomonas rhizomae TaxID=491948 RepID=A0A366JBM1_9GAMM|nr:YjbH domain-containing protein [Marinomonas rhizomae]RBP83298.1 exopolysaccharide biosynthesis protein YbjH [Marinomonas rhizomae]RNF68715.1 YjbH domain-containing protein [Marinomonas rhizomae]
MHALSPLFKRTALRYFVVIMSANTLLLPSSYASETTDDSDPFQLPEFKPSQMNSGGVGLIQVPSGRMADEGAFSLSYAQNDEYDFYTISLQLMPWLETTFRYTQVNDLLYSNDESFSGNTKLADKGIDVKARLWQESRYLPEVSIGLKDIGGTGLFDGEYLAGSKRFYTQDYGHFDVTLGLGWGYFGTRGNISNPFCSAADRFCDRLSSFSGNGGMVDYDRWFTGSASLFGGIEYQPPYEPLRLKLEYEGNDYSQDYPVTRGNVDMTPKTPWNIGAVYALSDGFDLRLSYERGTTFTLGFSLNTNFDSIKSPWIDEPIPEQNQHRPTTLEGVDWEKLDQELNKVAGYKTDKVYQDGDTLTLVAHQHKYRNRDTALEKASAVLSNELPENIQHYQIHETEKGLALRTTEISASQYQEIANVSYLNPKISDATSNLEPQDQTSQSFTSEPLYDDFEPLSYGFKPHLSQAFGGPEDFYIYNLSVKGGAAYWLTDQLELSAGVSINVFNNYDKLKFNVLEDGTSNYRVRTLIRAYVLENDALLSNLQLTWYQKYGQNWYQQVYGGYLETMFAGVGSEVMYRQPNTNWAIGADINLISQRDPSSVFGVFESDDAYSSSDKVLSRGSTGHVSVYYQPQWSFLQNTLFRVDMGKFLAGDVGARVDFSKQYKSGVIVGAYASKTDMSAEEFGEGSFTKGFYLSIPFDTLSFKPTTSRANLAWQPITRDGGQKLNRRSSLFKVTDMVSPWYQRPNQN